MMVGNNTPLTNSYMGNTDLRKYIQLQHPLSLAAAISYAVEFEAIDNQVLNERKPTHVRFNLETSESSCKPVLTDSDCSAKEKQLSDLIEHLNSLVHKLSVEEARSLAATCPTRKEANTKFVDPRGNLPHKRLSPSAEMAQPTDRLRRH